MSNKQIITTLYEHYKNTPKKLKIVCDWDEVIQACEPYALWLTIEKKSWKNNRTYCVPFTNFFKDFWVRDEMDYSIHGSEIKTDCLRKRKINYSDLENPKDFYQRAPFLTIAEDLLKLIKEDKVEKLIFLSAGDARKKEVFKETFGKFDEVDNTKEDWDLHKHKISLFLISEMFWIRTKADWIKEHASDFDLFIDDNPNICKSIIESSRIIKNCSDCIDRLEQLGIYRNQEGRAKCDRCFGMNIVVLTPHYPAIENQHHPEVLLVKNEVSNLKKEDFSKYEQ